MSTPEGKSYKDTLFLPKTDFPMKGNLTVREPARLEKWNSEGLYARIIAKRKAEGAPRFLLHDGPPFANGDVHMGTGLNKVLKDFVIKSKTMAGFEAPYIPGWDCHGLPIEFKVMQDEDARDVEPAEIRRRCETFARGWIDTQRESFKRLGVFGDWENPYLTLNPDYEANIIRTFAALIDKGCVYQSQKPVQWSYGAKTALAEAEVEYADKKSTAVFVPFAMTGEKWAGFDIAIWTTTPWTLPANLGIAVNERFVYVAGEFTNGEATRKLIVARELLGTVEEKTGWTPSSDLQEIKGAELENLDAQHPFLDRTSKILLANFVTAESGTGAVHIAPGHGADDYTVGQQYGLAVLSPVDDDGKFTEECGVPELVGQHVFKANARVVEILEEKGSLLGQETYAHSYPHCWRS
ncbi:class I tRNA ligase family protein, partial [Akkermansiaceae bacterium]|nr:class I tRNA ligase family protein [Akkermansiaceae bacterium]